MIRKAFKVGDTITIKRTANTSTGYRYVLVRLNGGVALIGETEESANTPDSMFVQSFTFQFLQSGLVEIQFACYRDAKDISYEDVFDYIVTTPETNLVVGGWSEFDTLTDKDKEVFSSCVNLRGVEYFPLLVSKQLVNGWNNRVFCMSRTVTEEAKHAFAMVTIYVPREGEPVLESIVEY